MYSEEERPVENRIDRPIEKQMRMMKTNKIDLFNRKRQQQHHQRGGAGKASSAVDFIHKNRFNIKFKANEAHFN